MLSTEMLTKIKGPILVLGRTGFIGGNLFAKLLSIRSDVYGASRDALEVMRAVEPATVFDCIAYGGYLAQTNVSEIYKTNVLLKEKLLSLAHEYGATYVHGGSSSEYGTILNAPPEETLPCPHTHYAIAKGAASGLINMYGKRRGLRCCNLRLYAVYGPGEREEDRLIPQMIEHAKRGTYPPLVNPDITRDFIHVDDVCEAYVTAALRLSSWHWGESFNIGTGVATSIRELAMLAKDVFGIPGDPVFSTQPNREYDFVGKWYANSDKALTAWDWRANISLREGLRAKGN